MGHFVKFKKMNQITARNDDLFESDSSDGSNLFVGTISQKDFISFDDRWNIALPTNGTIVKYKIEFNNLNNCPKLSKTNINLTAYNGTNIPVKDSCVVNIEHKNKIIPVSFIVADIHSPPILG